MTYNGNNKKRKQLKKRRVAYAIAETKTVKDAAEISDVSERTIYRWMEEDDDFRQELERIENRVTNAADSRINLLQEKAVRVMEEILDNEDIPPSIRLRACKLVLKKRNRDRISKEDHIREMTGRSKDPRESYVENLTEDELIAYWKELEQQRQEHEEYNERTYEPFFIGIWST